LTEYNSQISRISPGYQPDIKAFCTPDIMSCHPLQNSFCKNQKKAKKTTKNKQRTTAKKKQKTKKHANS